MVLALRSGWSRLSPWPRHSRVAYFGGAAKRSSGSATRSPPRGRRRPSISARHAVEQVTEARRALDRLVTLNETRFRAGAVAEARSPRLEMSPPAVAHSFEEYKAGIRLSAAKCVIRLRSWENIGSGISRMPSARPRTAAAKELSSSSAVLERRTWSFNFKASAATRSSSKPGAWPWLLGFVRIATRENPGATSFNSSRRLPGTPSPPGK
jgi:hypothetical protein